MTHEFYDQYNSDKDWQEKDGLISSHFNVDINVPENAFTLKIFGGAAVVSSWAVPDPFSGKVKKYFYLWKIFCKDIDLDFLLREMSIWASMCPDIEGILWEGKYLDSTKIPFTRTAKGFRLIKTGWKR